MIPVIVWQVLTAALLVAVLATLVLAVIAVRLLGRVLTALRAAPAVDVADRIEAAVDALRTSAPSLSAYATWGVADDLAPLVPLLRNGVS